MPCANRLVREIRRGSKPPLESLEVQAIEDFVHALVGVVLKQVGRSAKVARHGLDVRIEHLLLERQTLEVTQILEITKQIAKAFHKLNKLCILLEVPVAHASQNKREHTAKLIDTKQRIQPRCREVHRTERSEE